MRVACMFSMVPHHPFKQANRAVCPFIVQIKQVNASILCVIKGERLIHRVGWCVRFATVLRQVLKAIASQARHVEYVIRSPASRNRLILKNTSHPNMKEYTIQWQNKNDLWNTTLEVVFLLHYHGRSFQCREPPWKCHRYKERLRIKGI